MKGFHPGAGAGWPDNQRYGYPPYGGQNATVMYGAMPDIQRGYPQYQNTKFPARSNSNHRTENLSRQQPVRYNYLPRRVGPRKDVFAPPENLAYPSRTKSKVAKLHNPEHDDTVIGDDNMEEFDFYHRKSETANQSVESSIDEVIGQRISQYGRLEYLAKLEGSSYQHTQWLEEDDFLFFQNGAETLELYKKIGINSKAPFINPLFLSPEHVLAIRDGDPDPYVLVKWCGLGLRHCTWENSTDSNLQKLIKDFYHRVEVPDQCPQHQVIQADEVDGLSAESVDILNLLYYNFFNKAPIVIQSAVPSIYFNIIANLTRVISNRHGMYSPVLIITNNNNVDVIASMFKTVTNLVIFSVKNSKYDLEALLNYVLFVPKVTYDILVLPADYLLNQTVTQRLLFLRWMLVVYDHVPGMNFDWKVTSFIGVHNPGPYKNDAIIINEGPHHVHVEIIVPCPMTCYERSDYEKEIVTGFKDLNVGIPKKKVDALTNIINNSLAKQPGIVASKLESLRSSTSTTTRFPMQYVDTGKMRILQRLGAFCAKRQLRLLILCSDVSTMDTIELYFQRSPCPPIRLRQTETPQDYSIQLLDLRPGRVYDWTPLQPDIVVMYDGAVSPFTYFKSDVRLMKPITLLRLITDRSHEELTFSGKRGPNEIFMYAMRYALAPRRDILEADSTMVLPDAYEAFINERQLTFEALEREQLSFQPAPRPPFEPEPEPELYEDNEPQKDVVEYEDQLPPAPFEVESDINFSDEEEQEPMRIKRADEKRKERAAKRAEKRLEEEREERKKLEEKKLREEKAIKRAQEKEERANKKKKEEEKKKKEMEEKLKKASKKEEAEEKSKKRSRKEAEEKSKKKSKKEEVEEKPKKKSKKEEVEEKPKKRTKKEEIEEKPRKKTRKEIEEELAAEREQRKKEAAAKKEQAKKEAAKREALEAEQPPSAAEIAKCRRHRLSSMESGASWSGKWKHQVYSRETESSKVLKTDEWGSVVRRKIKVKLLKSGHKKDRNGNITRPVRKMKLTRELEKQLEMEPVRRRRIDPVQLLIKMSEKEKKEQEEEISKKQLEEDEEVSIMPLESDDDAPANIPDDIAPENNPEGAQEKQQETKHEEEESDAQECDGIDHRNHKKDDSDDGNEESRKRELQSERERVKKQERQREREREKERERERNHEKQKETVTETKKDLCHINPDGQLIVNTELAIVPRFVEQPTGADITEKDFQYLWNIKDFHALFTEMCRNCWGRWTHMQKNMGALVSVGAIREFAYFILEELVKIDNRGDWSLLCGALSQFENNWPPLYKKTMFYVSREFLRDYNIREIKTRLAKIQSMMAASVLVSCAESISDIPVAMVDEEAAPCQAWTHYDDQVLVFMVWMTGILPRSKGIEKAYPFDCDPPPYEDLLKRFFVITTASIGTLDKIYIPAQLTDFTLEAHKIFEREFASADDQYAIMTALENFGDITVEDGARLNMFSSFLSETYMGAIVQAAKDQNLLELHKLMPVVSILHLERLGDRVSVLSSARALIGSQTIYFEDRAFILSVLSYGLSYARFSPVLAQIYDRQKREDPLSLTKRLASIVASYSNDDDVPEFESDNLIINLPVKLSNTFRLVNLGTIVNEPGYATTDRIYPAGYRAETMFSSLSGEDKQDVYACIVERGENGPIFVVESFGRRFDGETPDDVWDQIFEAVRKAGGPAVMPTYWKVGHEMFGFDFPIVARFIQQLPGAEDFFDYQMMPFKTTVQAIRKRYAHLLRKPDKPKPTAAQQSLRDLSTALSIEIGNSDVQEKEEEKEEEKPIEDKKEEPEAEDHSDEEKQEDKGETESPDLAIADSSTNHSHSLLTKPAPRTKVGNTNVAPKSRKQYTKKPKELVKKLKDLKKKKEESQESKQATEESDHNQDDDQDSQHVSDNEKELRIPGHYDDIDDIDVSIPSPPMSPKSPPPRPSVSNSSDEEERRPIPTWSGMKGINGEGPQWNTAPISKLHFHFKKAFDKLENELLLGLNENKLNEIAPPIAMDGTDWMRHILQTTITDIPGAN